MDVIKKPTLVRKAFASDEAGMALFLIVVSLVVGLINPTFFWFDNIIVMLRSISFTVIVGIGLTFVLIGGGLDLSIGSIIGLGGVVTGMCLVSGLGVVLAIIAGVLVGALCGLVNGIITCKLKIPALIVTLGMMYICRGTINVLTRGRPVYPFPEAFNSLGTGELFRIPYSVYIMLFLVLGGTFILKYTVLGRSIYAIGGNAEASRTSGIQIDRVRIITYVITGILAAFAGILMSARTNSAVPNAGTGWELSVMAAVIIGGTSMFGGVGSIVGTFIGAGIMAVLTNALVMLKVDAYWQNIVVGVIIILAVGLDQYKRYTNKK